MKTRRPMLIAIDGVSGRAVAAAARAEIKKRGRRRAGISWWDASGLFDQLAVAEGDCGKPSARTLLLLYAADLAFRIRWEIEPALREGRTVIAAPYVDTAIAFGRGAGLASGWLTNVFNFVLSPGERHHIMDATPRRSSRAVDGFVECACAHLSGHLEGFTQQHLVARTRAHLKVAANRTKPRK